MQQPVPQHDQMSAQQMQQQMVLCPVRVVYETQILVQPGEQIQPNQTLFINPQNPPPWAQSRPVQNQVIYVQQMPGNIMPSIPQHLDQNQLYLHQYPGYQQGIQMVPQQMIPNVQENRPNTIQMSNLIHQNMLPNFQTNLPSNMNQNIQAMPDRTIQQANFGQLQQNVGPNMQMQQQMNLTSNNIINRTNETMTNIQGQVQQSQYNNQKVELKQTYIGQSPNVARTQPQVLTVNPIQNMPQTANMQTFATSVVRPIKTESVASQIAPTYVNAAQNTQITRIRKVAPTSNMKPNQTVGIRSVGQTQTFRSIQPRPIQQFRPNLPTYSTIEPMNSNQANSMPLLNQNMISVNSNTPIQNPSTNAISFIKTEDLNMNRKRKSESPDEIHKKMAAIQVNYTTQLKQINDVSKRPSEIVANTNPLNKNQMIITPSILQPNVVNIDVTRPLYHNVQPVDVKNTTYLNQNVQQSMKPDPNNTVKLSLEPIEPLTNMSQKEDIQSPIVDKDKLIRNTVFPQARGRVITDKEALVVPAEPTIPESVSLLKELTVTPKDSNVETKHAGKPEIKKTPSEDLSKKEGKSDDAKIENNVTDDVKKERKDNKIEVERKEPSDMKVTLNTTNNKGMFPMDRAGNQEKDYILTHVLDGIVIQESNVAFPIREPLIKRITQSTAQINKEEKKLEIDVKCICKPDEPTIDVKSQSSESSSVKDGVAQGDNPFVNLSTTTVKSWTTKELSSHLSARGWDDTAALFLDHEIDGESLFLVSKAQLEAIGVSEEHADVICAHVKS